MKPPASPLPGASTNDASTHDVSTHEALIDDQFTRQAAGFAGSPELHNDDVLRLVVEAGAPRATDVVVDLACGPGSVALAFAPQAARVEGLDATEAMLAQARAAGAASGRANVTWRTGTVYALPYADRGIDIVVSRFAIHHFQDPPAAMAEMRRVAAPGARLVICDAVADDDGAKAAAFNEMERWSDPSTVEFRRLDYLMALYRAQSLVPRLAARFQVPYLAHELVARAFPARDDRAGLLALIEASVDGDLLGMRARRTPAGTQIAFQCVVLVATVP